MCGGWCTTFCLCRHTHTCKHAPNTVLHRMLPLLQLLNLLLLFPLVFPATAVRYVTCVSHMWYVCMSAQVFDVLRCAQVFSGSLVLSPGTALTWSAFSTEGLLTTMDRYVRKWVLRGCRGVVGGRECFVCTDAGRVCSLQWAQPC